MKLEYPTLPYPRLLIKKPPISHLLQDNAKGRWIQLLAESSNLWHTSIGSTSVLPCSARGMRENTAHLFSTNSLGRACFCLFHLLVAQKKNKTYRDKTSIASEKAPKATILSSWQWALRRPARLFAAIHPQFGYEVIDEHPSLWIYPQELWNVAPLKAHRGTSCWL